MCDKDKYPWSDLFPFSPYGPKPEGTHPLDPTYTSFDPNKDNEKDSSSDNDLYKR